MPKGDRFVNVSREAIEAALNEAGFKPCANSGELVYQRAHKSKPALFVKVYTSIALSAEDAHSLGKDAIRVCLVWQRICKTTRKPCEWTPPCLRTWEKIAVVCKHCGRTQSQFESKGLVSEARVYRTGSEKKVIGRMLERARDAYATANATEVCYTCCAPVYEDSGKCIVRECGGYSEGRKPRPQTGLRLVHNA